MTLIMKFVVKYSLNLTLFHDENINVNSDWYILKVFKDEDFQFIRLLDRRKTEKKKNYDSKDKIFSFS